MKAIMVMFDSLNRLMLPPYGCDWVHAPNFQRLAERSATFENSYVCSMPCMPARRDLHTGRPNFLHRSWGPLEPFDASVPRMLSEGGVSSHLVSDHQHYWEAGGATYHTQYSTWQFFRGQEGDVWMGQVADPPKPNAHGRNADNARWPHRQDLINRQFMRRPEEQPQYKTFAAGIDFIRRNSRDDDWFLQIETFDPHEPFFTQRMYQDLYRDRLGDRNGPLFDWPSYGAVRESDELVQQCRAHYAALVSMCDASLGNVLDEMDRLDLWDDTMLMVWTDHGFLLGEHDMWAKVHMPWYQEMAHTPFFVWDPRSGVQSERRKSLVQPSLDLGPTLLDFFGMERDEYMLGHALGDVVAGDQPVREAALFGHHGGQVNVTDGRYVYMRGPATETNAPLYNYTLMPTHMRSAFSPDELQSADFVPGFSHMRGCNVLRTEAGGRWPSQCQYGHLLFDLECDPNEQSPLTDAGVEGRMINHLVNLMRACDAPDEQYVRLGLNQ